MFRIELTQEQVDIMVQHRQRMLWHLEHGHLTNFNVKSRFEQEVKDIDLFLSLLNYEVDEELTIKDVKRK